MARFTSYRRLSHKSTTQDWERQSRCSFPLADTVSPVSSRPVAAASQCTCSVRLWRLASMSRLSCTYCGSEIKLSLMARSGDWPHRENSPPSLSRCMRVGSFVSPRITEEECSERHFPGFGAQILAPPAGMAFSGYSMEAFAFVDAA